MGFFDDIFKGVSDSFNDTVDGVGKAAKEWADLPKTQTLFKKKEERKDVEFLKLKKENRNLRAKIKKKEETYKVKYKPWGSW
jgi:cell shape-determining protein MreC